MHLIHAWQQYLCNGERCCCIVFKNLCSPVFLYCSAQFLSLSLSLSLSPLSLFLSISHKHRINAHLSEILSRSISRQTCNVLLFFLSSHRLTQTLHVLFTAQWAHLMPFQSHGQTELHFNFNICFTRTSLEKRHKYKIFLSPFW